VIAGRLVIVRPDQYVAQVLPLDGYEQLASHFDGFMLLQTGRMSNGRQGSLSEAPACGRIPR
jgi:hypothetical protein